ncbi:hypothetical protein EDC01DRAFT_757054 [Geopyxis carbonaria]|nr:hypothetical protein EDC01DRAFT_757054 [Geopyxis carbonaria]
MHQISQRPATLSSIPESPSQASPSAQTSMMPPPTAPRAMRTPTTPRTPYSPYSPSTTYIPPALRAHASSHMEPNWRGHQRRATGTWLSPLPVPTPSSPASSASPHSRARARAPASTQADLIAPGTVLWVMIHQTCAPALSESANGSSLLGAGTIFSKSRPAVVAAVFAQHFVVLPMYTFGGRGVRGRGSGKREEGMAEEFVSVFDKRNGGGERQSRWEPLWMEGAERGRQVLKTVSAVHVAGPVKVAWYDEVEVVGRLDGGSVRAMKEYLREVVAGV